MDTSKIVQFRLLRENITSHTYDSRYWFDTINVESFEDNINSIKKVIKYHHQDLNWEGTPTEDIVLQRLKFGSQCHLWMYEDTCLGWHWTNTECITLDWKSYFQPLKKNEIYIGGAFVSRDNKPERGKSAGIFYRQGFEYSFELTQSDTMYLYSDSWNRASAILCYRSGFTQFNFIS